ncbi:Xaa-Pro dipeptidase [Chlamydiales bacterium SCGC AG-110-P3]|nr:Xaa-Pro dipeptidase [Chlamydiales bacterium SCGC AG-110-P3]
MERIKKLQATLKSHGVDGLIIDDTTDLYYLTGLSLSLGRLLVTQRLARLFVDGRYYETATKQAPCPVTLSPPTTLFDALEKTKISSLGFDAAITTVQDLSALRKGVARVRRARGSPVTLKPLTAPVAPLRMYKDASELRILRKAARLGNSGFEHVKTLLKEGVTEAEVAAKLEIFWLQQGGQSLAFEPIIAFGANSSKPHYSPGKTRLRLGQPILVDIGVTVDHYHSDMTRVLFYGTPKPIMKRVYHAVLEAQTAALALCRPGTSIADLDKTAREVLATHDLGDKFTHSLGHGIGLQVHEQPGIRQSPTTRKQRLAPGMVITIEPGAYLPNVGGVRIEDTVIITEQGHQNLTSPSKALTVL